MRIKPIVVFNKRLLSFIPFKHVVIQTTLGIDDAVDLIASSISPIFNTIWGSIPRSPKQFQGEVSEKGFKIRVTDHYRGSLTWVVGKFISDTNGIKIDMYVRPNPIFLVGFIFLPLAICGFILSIIHNDLIGVFVSLFGILFFGLGHILETDTVDWFIGNLFGVYIAEDKRANS